MISKEATIIKEFLQSMKMQEREYDKTTLTQQRQQYESSMLQATRLPDTVTIQPFMIEHLAAEWIIDTDMMGDNGKVILYFHGGGLMLGSCKTHHGIAAAISASCKCRVLIIDYRLAPEYPYPAANEDCLLAYQWLLDSGIDSQDIIIGGDSGGAALTLMTMISLRDTGRTLPRAAFLLSLFGDFVHFDGESYIVNAQKDLIGSLETTRISTQYFIGHLDEKPLLISPIRCDLSNLPPLFIQAAGDEIVLSDSLRLAERAEQAGVSVTLEVWDDMWHFFQSFSAIVPEAREAVDQIGKFIMNYTKNEK